MPPSALPCTVRLAAASLAFFIAFLPETAFAQRQQFIDHLITFRSLLFGPYGDEGERIVRELELISIALAEWDNSVRAGEQRVRTSGGASGGGVDERASLAQLFASRGRFGAALFEIEAALALDPGRRQLHTLRGRLLDAYRHETEAASAYRRAWELDRGDAVSAYLAFSALSSPAAAQSTATPIDTLLAAHRRATSFSSRYGPEPIRDVQLIPDRSSRTPVFAPPAYADGFSALSAGNYAQALDRLRAAAMRDPLVVDQALRSTALSAGIARLRAGLMAEAIPLLESAASTYPDSSEAHRILGSAYGATGDDGNAVEHLQRAVSLTPRDGRSRLSLARALRDAGRLDEAAQSLRDALTILPRLAEARWMLADVLEKTGRGLDAARELEAAASATVIAGKGALYSRAAEIYDRHQEFDRVVTLLRHRVSLDPNNPAVHRQLGLVYSRLGRREEALAELVMADLLGGADAESLAAIGQIHLDAGRLDDAEAIARRAIAVQPDRQDARYVLGRTLLRQGRTDEAREQLEVFQRLRAGALTEQRRTFEIDKLRADAARASAAGRHRDAASIWQRIVEQMPRVPGFHVAAADAFAASGELEDATVHLEKAASLGGGPAVRLRLADLYERLGRREDSERARRFYEQEVKELLNSSRP